MIRLAGTLVAACAILTGSLATPAAAEAGAVRPNQHFVGLVNGKHSGAVIYTICPGPAAGRSGPPAGNQTVAVQRVAAGGGDTGAGGRVIYARITPSSVIGMKRYGRPAPIPTNIQVPCQGSGTIVFSTCPLPQPCGRGARVDSVPVTYIDIAA